MKEAVRKVLLQGIYDNGVIKKGKKHDPRTNWALSLAWDKKAETMTDEQIGKKLIAVAEGIRFVETSFDKIGSYKKAEPVTPKKNNAI